MKARKINGIIESYSTKPESIISIITGQIQPTWKYASEEEEFAEGFETVIEPLLAENQYFGEIFQHEDGKFEFEILEKIMQTPFAAFPIKTVLRELQAVFLYDIADKLSGQAAIIRSHVENKEFHDLNIFLNIMEYKGLIDAEKHGIINTIFLNQGIDLSTEPYRS